MRQGASMQQPGSRLGVTIQQLSFINIKNTTMATGDLNVLFKQLRGALGKQIVIKQYKNKTVITAFPKSSTKKKKKPSPVQSIYREDFAKAVKYAQAIIYNPAKKKSYAKKVMPGQTVYNYAIAEYKQKYGVKKGK